jgi:hypothetical protein
LTWLIRALAGINAIAALSVGLSRLKWPSGFWDGRDDWIAYTLIGVCVASILLPIMSELGEKARRQAVERRQQLHTFLASSLVYIARHSGADWETTGVQAFLVKRRWLRETHVAEAKVRLRPIPASGVQWTKGKGLIGRCWETRQPQFVDLAAHFADYEQLGAEDFGRLPEATRFGLTFDDFQRLKGKYGIVAASPIVDEKGRYLGCVTADFPVEGDHGTIPQAPVLESLMTTARLVVEVL